MSIKRYPRSFLQLVAWGNLIVIAPLVLMAGYAVLTLDQLAGRYESVVRYVTESGRLSADLADDLRNMELDLRRHEILQTAETFAYYEETRKVWRNHMAAFSRLEMLTPHLPAELNEQLGLEQAAFEALFAERDTGKMQHFLEVLRGRQEKTLEQVRQDIDREQSTIRASSRDLVAQLALALAMALALAALLWWLVKRLLSTLIGRFERVVIALGRGDLHTQILLDGPGDMRWLGRWLDWLRKRLLSLEESRAQVLRHVSHELKTPLAAIHEGASLLADQVSGPLNPAQSRVVGIVRSNAKRLQDLIDGLLRLQQADHAAERIGYENLRYDEIVAQVVETYRLVAQEARIVLRENLQPLEIVAGREGLLTIVHNLISNAVKFSPVSGTVSIALYEQDGEAVLEVEDEGPGIPNEDAARIFEPFYRAPAVRHIGGVGLGLAILREFVLAHRGTIEVRPYVPGQGAMLTVRLPLRATYLRQQACA